MFGNAKKHGLIARAARKLDPFSSAIAFDWWEVPLPDHPLRAKIPRIAPRTQLLKRTFLYEPLRLDEAPAPRSAKTASGRRGIVVP